MLHFVNSFIKFAQSPTCYIVDFIYVSKICQGDLYQSYVDPMYDFEANEFNIFKSLAYDISLVIEREWVFC